MMDTGKACSITSIRFLISLNLDQFVLISILTPRPRRVAPRAVMHSKNPGNNLTPNYVTITESASDRKEQQFSVLSSASNARQDSRLGCRQIPAQAFHDQSVDLLKELLRDS